MTTKEKVNFLRHFFGANCLQEHVILTTQVDGSDGVTG